MMRRVSAGWRPGKGPMGADLAKAVLVGRLNQLAEDRDDLGLGWYLGGVACPAPANVVVTAHSAPPFDGPSSPTLNTTAGSAHLATSTASPTSTSPSGWMTR